MVDSERARARVWLASSEPIRQLGLASAFEDHPTIEIVPGELEALLADPEVRFLIVDLSEDVAWLESVLRIRRVRPDIRPIVIGPNGRGDTVMQAISAGCRAYLDLNVGTLELLQATETVIEGSIWAPREILTVLIDQLLAAASGTAQPVVSPSLTSRERQVLERIMEGYSNREIAAELSIEERTVKAYVASLFRKTGVENRVALSVHATHGLMRESTKPPK